MCLYLRSRVALFHGISYYPIREDKRDKRITERGNFALDLLIISFNESIYTFPINQANKNCVAKTFYLPKLRYTLIKASLGGKCIEMIWL